MTSSTIRILYTFFFFIFFFLSDTRTTESYTLSLHDALPIFPRHGAARQLRALLRPRHLLRGRPRHHAVDGLPGRSEEHTSELQSRRDLVCRLLLEKKNNIFQDRSLERKSTLKVLD